MFEASLVQLICDVLYACLFFLFIYFHHVLLSTSMYQVSDYSQEICVPFSVPSFYTTGPYFSEVCSGSVVENRRDIPQFYHMLDVSNQNFIFPTIPSFYCLYINTRFIIFTSTHIIFIFIFVYFSIRIFLSNFFFQNTQIIYSKLYFIKISFFLINFFIFFPFIQLSSIIFINFQEMQINNKKLNCTTTLLQYICHSSSSIKNRSLTQSNKNPKIGQKLIQS